MADIQGAISQVEDLKDFGKGGEGELTRWKTELQLARKGPFKIWLKRYKDIVRRYRDERENSESGEVAEGGGKGFNLLWSNVRTQAPGIYSKTPKVIVKRRYTDESLTARAACLILMRALNFQMSRHGGQFHAMMKACRLDFQLGGKAECQVRYEQDDDYDEGDLIGPLKRVAEVPDGVEAYPNVISEGICFDYKHPDDILWSAARNWKEVEWVAYRSFMTKDQIREAEVFGKRADYIADNLPFKSRPLGMTDTDADRPENGALMRAPIWAIFSKRDRKIYYICEDWTEVLATADDPSSLEDFFPSPAPARDTVTNDTLIPVPSYTEYGPQARELDELTRRASRVLENIRVAGTYDAAHQELKALLDGGYENKLIGVTDWSQFAEKGGLEGAMDFLPYEESAKVLEILYRARTIAKQDADEMSGVFDVMRGESNPNETLGAQNMKAGFGDLRSSEPKEELARFARDALSIAGELIAEHFSPASLWQMSNFGDWYRTQTELLQPSAPTVPQPMPQPPSALSVGGNPAGGMPAVIPQTPALPPAQAVFLAAVGLLKNEKLRGFVITVETNSTVEPDAQIEQQKRSTFLEMAAKFLESAGQIAMMQPKLMPLLGQMLLFGVRGFDVGAELETVFETVLQQLEQAAANPAPKPPSPEEVKAQAAQQQSIMDAQQSQRESDMRMKELALEFQTKQAESNMRIAEMQMEMRKMAAELQATMQELNMKAQAKQQEVAISAQADIHQAALDQQTAEQKAELDRQQMVDNRAHQQEMSDLKVQQAKQMAAQKPAPGGGK